MNLIAMLKGERDESLSNARQRYVKLLRNDPSDSKSLAELRQLIETLNLTPEQIERDFNIVRRSIALRATITEGSGLDKARVAAAKALVDHTEEMQQQREKMNLAHQQLVIEQLRLESLWRNAQEALRQLQAVVQSRPDLLGDEELPVLV